MRAPLSMPDMTGDPTQDPAAETPDEGSLPVDDPTSGEGSDRPATDTPGHLLTAGLTIGNRVVVRYRLEEGSQARATDFIGELVARNDDFLIVDTKKQRVKLIRADVIAAKDVPPPASRPGPAHERVGADDLEVLMAKGWVAPDRAGLGDWVLRSAGGFTGRANSALVVGDPSLPVDKAIDYVERWYAERDAAPLFQLPGAPGFDVADVPAGAALLERGYVAGGGRADWTTVLVMTGLASAVPPLTTESAPVTADAKLSPEWLMTYGRSRSVVPGVTESVLTGSDGQLFLSVRDETSRQLVGIARLAIHPGWAGVFGLWVDPAHRRRGIASTIVSAAAMVARENAMPAIYLQVSSANTDGVAFWQSLGFGVHHDYTYLARPTA